MWLVGLVMAAVYVVIFAQSKLYAAMGLQIYYLGISLYGWWSWKKDKENISEDSLTINKFNWGVAGVSTGLAAALFVLMAYVFGEYTGNSQPILDSLIAALSALGTYWLSRSYIQQWFVWIVVNILSVLMFVTQGLYLTSVLYFVYVLAAIYGYYYWKKYGTY